jgi:hypothetical protein
MRKLEVGERILAVRPDPLNRIQFGTIRRQADRVHVIRHSEPLGCRRPVVIQKQEIQAVAANLREGIDEELKHLRVQIGTSQEETVARGVPTAHRRRAIRRPMQNLAPSGLSDSQRGRRMRMPSNRAVQAAG